MKGLQLLSTAGGAALAGAARVLAGVRRAAKPLHPHGDVLAGIVTRTGAAEATGVPWLDDPGEDQVLVRVSRAIGLPGVVPDIHGLALRVPVETRYADLLLASTGLGRVSRFVLTPSREVDGRPLTTLLPYRSPSGPLLVGARPLGSTLFELLWARPTGPFVSFGRLALAGERAPDPVMSFDPLVNTLPGLDNYGWVRRLREPAYAAARDTRTR